MKKELSCGAIIINDNKVLLVKHQKGHWDFPKGHVELNETKQQTALREVKEETNLDIKIVSLEEFKITYSPSDGIIKDVIYFLAKPVSFDIKPQLSEIEIIAWFSYDQALKIITYDNSRQLLEKVLTKIDKI